MQPKVALVIVALLSAGKRGLRPLYLCEGRFESKSLQGKM